MEGKLIIECFVVILVISLAFAAVYAAETDNAALSDSPDGQGHIHISKSSDVSHLDASLSEIPYNPAYNMLQI